MKRVPLYALLLALTICAPVRRVNVGQLEPVEAVFAVREGDLLTLTTDTDAQGSGSTAEAAYEAMKKTTPAVVYLDTAEYLLLSRSAMEDVQALRKLLRPSVKVCLIEGQLDRKWAVGYLDAHADLPVLRSWTEGTPIPVLSPLGLS